MEAICIVDFEKQEKARYVQKKSARFFEFYGVWFFGKLKTVVEEEARKRFSVDLGGRMHVFIEPEKVEKDVPKLSDGIHEVRVYGHACRLFKWTSQGYHRGLVVLDDDLEGNLAAAVYYESGTWSWQLSKADNARLPDGQVRGNLNAKN